MISTPSTALDIDILFVFREHVPCCGDFADDVGQGMEIAVVRENARRRDGSHLGKVGGWLEEEEKNVLSGESEVERRETGRRLQLVRSPVPQRLRSVLVGTACENRMPRPARPMHKSSYAPPSLCDVQAC